MSRMYILSLIAWCCLLLTACERRPLEEDIYTKALIPVKAYWDLAEITPKNATVLVYDQGGSLYLESSFSSEGTFAYDEIALAPGTYTVIVFNEVRNQISNVKIRGHEQLATLEAYIAPATTTYKAQSKAEGDRIVEKPEMLAVSKVEHFVVTEEMVTRSHYLKAQSKGSMRDTKVTDPEDTAIYGLTDLHPQKKVSTVSVTTHVKGLNNAFMPVLCELRNMAEGYLFATDRNTQAPVTVQFLMNNRVYDPGSTKNGTIYGTVTSFGVLGDRRTVEDTPENKVILQMSFKLRDEVTQVDRAYEVTNLLRIEEGKAEISIAIQIEVEQLPDVKPAGSNSGMSSEVVDWERETITIDLS